MEPHQKTIHPCPFCHKETLEVLTWPAHTSISVSRSAIAKGTTYKKRPEGFELLSEKCSNCGKTEKEIKRAWREGIKDIDMEKKKRRLEELKALGFSGTFGRK